MGAKAIFNVKGQSGVEGIKVIDTDGVLTMELNGTQVMGEQAIAEANYTITWTANEPTAGDTATIADGAIPTVAELGQAVADLTAKTNSLLAKLRTHGIIAT